jgi:DNA-binding transcriptional LysR family regulator
MELRDFEYFAVIAEHGHLGRAADALKLSQPALSKSLRRLEQALHVRLVKRTPKGVELTAEGSVVLLRVRELRLSLQSITREIADVGEGRVGHLRIGAGMAISEHFLSTAYGRLLKDSPRTELKVSVSDNDVMIPALHRGDLDLIVNYYPAAHPEGLVCEHLFDDETVVCASITHRLAKRKRVTLAEVARERWALSEPILLGRRWLYEKFRDGGFESPHVGMEARSANLRLWTVAASDLLDFTSRSFMMQSAVAPRLKILPVVDLKWIRPIGLLYRRESYLPPALLRFIGIIRAIARSTSTRHVTMGPNYP